MAVDVSRHLDRAKRFLERNKVQDAIEAYLAVLEESPTHQEATQALGDLYARLDKPDRAAVYYGALFDLLTESKDEPKAVAIYSRFLKSSGQQPPERIARYALLLQKQNRVPEAIEQYDLAADLLPGRGREEDALACLERIAELDPETITRHLKLAETAAHLGARGSSPQRATITRGRSIFTRGLTGSCPTIAACRCFTRNRSCAPAMPRGPGSCSNPSPRRQPTPHFSKHTATR